MNLGKIALTVFAIVIAIGVTAFVSIITVADAQINSKEIIAEQKPATIESIPLSKNHESMSFTNHRFPESISKEPLCTGSAQCIDGFVTRVIDGDTMVVGDKSIRFALVNTPEWGDYDYSRARSYVETICPIGSKVLVDEDDGQSEGSFGRIIGKIYCNGMVLNEEILVVGHAIILTEFCPVSEFAQESWAKKHGC